MGIRRSLYFIIYPSPFYAFVVHGENLTSSSLVCLTRYTEKVAVARGLREMTMFDSLYRGLLQDRAL